MANPDNTNQGQMGNQANQGQYGAGGLYGNQGQMGQMGQGVYGNQGQYGYTGYPGAANQGQWGMQGHPGQMNRMANQGQMGQTFNPTIGPHTGHGPQNYQRSDQRIKEDVSDRLMAHGHLDARGINVSVNNGEVTLSGTVNSRQDKRTADDIADSVTGVKDVNNQLKVQQQGQQGQQASH